MKIIETRYKDILFRSRIEARWGVFYDSIGIPWVYEAEGYDLGGAWYLPDFWMPQQGCFIEIKGDLPDLRAEILASTLAHQSEKLVHVFFGQIPAIDVYGAWRRAPKPLSECWTYTPQITRESGRVWCFETASGEYRIENIKNVDGRHLDSVTDELVQAYYSARSERFRR